MSVACFQILSNGKVKAITKHQYLKRLGRKGYTIGYTDGSWILFSRNGEVITSTYAKIMEIFELPKELHQKPSDAEQSRNCPIKGCGHVMRHYFIAGKGWWKCQSSYCGYVIFDDELKGDSE